METVYRVRTGTLGKTHGHDFNTAAGKNENLVGRIQERYGLAKEEAEKQTDEWSAALKESAREVSAQIHMWACPPPSKQI